MNAVVQKANATMDAIVKSYMTKHYVAEYVAHERLSRLSPEYRAAYREAEHGKALGNAKRFAPTAGNDVKKHGSGDGGGELETRARRHAAENKVPIWKAYDEVLKTADGKRLYRESLGATP